jgi:hypothetical protein
MYKFKGTINGVEYTDRKSFFEALKSTRNNGSYQVSLEETRNDGALKESPVTIDKKPVEEKKSVNTDRYNELFNALGGLFISFLKAENPTLYNKLAKTAQEKEEQETRRVSQPSNIAFTYQGSSEEFNRILTKYFFKDTTYEFVGGAEDAFHLDRFAGLLSSRAKEIACETINLNRAQKKVLYYRALSEFSRIQKAIGEIEDTLTVTDRQLAGLERVIDSYKEINFKVPNEISTSYEEQKHAFDILSNRKNYYQMLLEHYRNIGPYFDPEH